MNKQNILSNASRDSNVYILSPGFTATAARAVVACFFVVFLLAPAIVCKILDSQAHRIIVVVLSTVLLIVALSGLTRAKTVEMFLAATA